MGVVGWLEPVLSWPRRFIVGGDERFAETGAELAARQAGAREGASAAGEAASAASEA